MDAAIQKEMSGLFKSVFNKKPASTGDFVLSNFDMSNITFERNSLFLYG